jgi:hypothetical protein
MSGKANTYLCSSKEQGFDGFDERNTCRTKETPTLTPDYGYFSMCTTKYLHGTGSTRRRNRKVLDSTLNAMIVTPAPPTLASCPGH